METQKPVSPLRKTKTCLYEPENVYHGNICILEHRYTNYTLMAKKEQKGILRKNS
jgi:hypothetical protein